MNAPVSFGSVFLRAFHATRPEGSDDFLLRDSSIEGFNLSIEGDAGRRFTFSNLGVGFEDEKRKYVLYRWDDLDFIFPGDLSLANDKLHVFTNLDTFAFGIGRRIGLITTVAALALLLILFAFAQYRTFIRIDTNFGAWSAGWHWLASILESLILLVLGILFAIFDVALAISLPKMTKSCADGLGKLLQPVVRWRLPEKYKRFPNGIFVVKHSWVKPPLGTPATNLVDLVLLGVKLRRRGLT